MNQYTAEINQLKKALVENNSQLIAMEAACIRETDRHVELEDSLIAWQDKYERLHESHKRVQKVNQSLEDKLLKLVDRNANERAQLTSDVATLSVRLAQANYNIGTLQREIVSKIPVMNPPTYTYQTHFNPTIFHFANRNAIRLI